MGERVGNTPVTEIDLRERERRALSSQTASPSSARSCPPAKLPPSSNFLPIAGQASSPPLAHPSPSRATRYPSHAKACYCQGCYNALQLNKKVEAKAMKLLQAIPKPFLSLHLRFEPDMVAYSRCEYSALSSKSLDAIEAARGEDRNVLIGDAAHLWRNRGKCPLTPSETAFILQALGIPTETNIYLAAGDGLMELEGFTSIYKNMYTKSSLLTHEDFERMHGNTKAVLDYYVSVNSDAYVATFFGNMDKMVTAMRTMQGLQKTLVLSRRAFANYTAAGLAGDQLAKAMWDAHREDYILGRGLALPEHCFCEFKL